jgi:hypothetical protein
MGDTIGLGQIMGVGTRLRRRKLPHGGSRWGVLAETGASQLLMLSPVGESEFVLRIE